MPSPRPLAACAALLLAAISSLNAQSVTTTPVGAMTFTVAAPSGGQPESYAYNAISLARPAVFSGIVDSQINGTNSSIIDNEANWADNAFNPTISTTYPTHYIEFTSGPLIGLTLDIQATSQTNKSISINQNLSSSNLAGSSYKIREHWTLNNLFGPTNGSGLKSGLPTTADLLHVWTGTSYKIFYHRKLTNGTVVGWRSTLSTSIDEGSAVIYPDEGVFVKRRDTSPLSAIYVGEVKGDSTAVSIGAGFNLVSCLSAKDITLADSQLFTNNDATGLKAGLPTTADLIQFWDGSAIRSYYVRKLNTGALQGWRSTLNTSTPEDTAIIPAGTAVIIRRQTGSNSFVWSRPIQQF